MPSYGANTGSANFSDGIGWAFAPGEPYCTVQNDTTGASSTDVPGNYGGITGFGFSVPSDETPTTVDVVVRIKGTVPATTGEATVALTLDGATEYGTPQTIVTTDTYANHLLSFSAPGYASVNAAAFGVYLTHSVGSIPANWDFISLTVNTIQGGANPLQGTNLANGSIFQGRAL